MRIFLTGATGLIGRRLVLDRLERGDEVVVLSRDRARAARMFAADVNPAVTVVAGDPTRDGDWTRALDGADAVVNLVGRNLADRRWSEDFKRELVASRVDATRRVVDAIHAADATPRVLVSASAVGYYGDRGNEPVDESTPAGDDFVARLCREWEGAARPVEDAGVRLAILRIAPVLDERGGMIEKLLGLFRRGLGGRLGSGRQWMSWIHHRDLVGLVDLALRDARVRGPLNVAAPNPATNREFTRALARAVHRPAILPVPRVALRLAVGELASSLLASQRVVPQRALDLGFRFLYPAIEAATRSVVEAADRARDGGRGEDAPSDAEETDALAAMSIPASAGVEPRIHGLGEPGDRPTGPPACVRLLAIDVDGTILRSDGRISQGVIDACRAAERTGCVVVPTSARPPRTTAPLVRTLGTVGPTINYNGALIWNPLENRPLHHQPLDSETAKAVIDAAREADPDALVAVEILDRWHTDRLDPGRPVGEEPESVGRLEAVLDEPVSKIDLVAEPARAAAVFELVRDRFWSARRVAVYRTTPTHLQIVHPLAEKAIALQRIAKRLGAAREEVMAIGDGSNDAGMIEWAGWGVAVGNASDAVKALADAVVHSNDEVGVARAIRRYVLAQPEPRVADAAELPRPGREPS